MFQVLMILEACTGSAHTAEECRHRSKSTQIHRAQPTRKHTEHTRSTTLQPAVLDSGVHAEAHKDLTRL